MRTLIDRYTMGARVAPVLLAAAPLFFALSAWIPFDQWPVKLFGSSAVLAFAAFVLAQPARDAGKAIEKPIWDSWGGPPTVRMLRHRDTTYDAGTKARIHQRLIDLHVVGRMPSPAEEEQDPAQADAVYLTCSNWLRNKALELKAKSPFDVVHAENIAYGFRRNLLGIRRIALLITALSAIAAGTAFHFGRLPYPELGGVAFLGLCILAIATKAGLKRSADNYSHRLLNAIEAIPVPATKAAPVRKPRARRSEEA